VIHFYTPTSFQAIGVDPYQQIDVAFMLSGAMGGPSSDKRRTNMAHKVRSPSKVPSTPTEIDALRDLYEELSPPWTLGSVDYRTPFDWDPAVFGTRKRPHVHQLKHDLKHAA
jgi:hypothetical protein